MGWGMFAIAQTCQVALRPHPNGFRNGGSEKVCEPQQISIMANGRLGIPFGSEQNRRGINADHLRSVAGWHNSNLLKMGMATTIRDLPPLEGQSALDKPRPPSSICTCLANAQDSSSLATINGHTECQCLACPLVGNACLICVHGAPFLLAQPGL